VKKFMLIGVMVAMVLAASAPALTQTAPNDIDASPVLDTNAVQTSGDASVDPAPAPTPAPVPAGPTVGCGVLYNDPAATCPVDASGNIALPDGSTAPVLVRPDGTVFIQDASGALTLIGQGASFITTS
jgi:hypothetical protein